MKKEIKTSIYVELDALIDTRLTLLGIISPKLSKKLLMNGKWFTRVIDSFKVYSSAYFSALYDKRNEKLLEKSNPTYIMDIIHETIKIRRELTLSLGQEGRHILYVNTYPYILSNEESLLLKIGIASKLLESVDVEIIYEPNITVDFISKKCYIMIMYEGMRWINDKVYEGSLLSNSIPDVLMITPAIIGSEDGLEILTKKAFEDIANECELYIKINFIDSSYFSVPQIKSK